VICPEYLEQILFSVSFREIFVVVRIASIHPMTFSSTTDTNDFSFFSLVDFVLHFEIRFYRPADDIFCFLPHEVLETQRLHEEVMCGELLKHDFLTHR
jgi:hypothetical protein